MDTAQFDINSLLQNSSPSNLVGDALQPLITAFIVFTVVSIVLTIVIVVVWIIGLVRRRKVQAAIFDIQAILREMNERDKSRRSTDSAPRLANTKVAQPIETLHSEA